MTAVSRRPTETDEPLRAAEPAGGRTLGIAVLGGSAPGAEMSLEIFSLPHLVQTCPTTAYFAAGAPEKAIEMSNAFCDYYYKRLDYFLKQKPFIINSAEFEIQTAIQYTSRVANALTAYGKPEMGDTITKKLESYYADYVKIVQPAGK